MYTSPIRYFSSPDLYQKKEACYVEVRRREGRVLTDDLVQMLPTVAKSSVYAKEWAMRRRSFLRLSRRIKSQSDRPKRILDLGCGNGWMANHLAKLPGVEVWAMDLNAMELEQGARLFGRENLHFAYADLLAMADLLDRIGKFDWIVLAASVQYFEDLNSLMVALRNLLRPGGEIHVLDAPFYTSEAARTAARQRSLEYYTRMGVSEMASFYHHHLWEEAKRLGGQDLNSGWGIKFLQKIKWLPPFPWFCFK